MTNEEYTKAMEFLQEAKETIHGVCKKLFPEVVSWDTDRMEMVSVFHTDEEMANPAGWLHGGLIATIFDNGLGVLAHSHASSYFTPTSTMNLEYLRPVPIPGDIYLHGKVIKLGRTLIHVRGELLEFPGSEKPFAIASAIFYKAQVTAKS